MHHKSGFRQPRDPQRPTHFLWWIFAIFCAIITVAVIIAGIVVFIGYLVIHPRIPIVKVTDAHLYRFDYDQAGLLQTQMTILVRSENDNLKAHAIFSDFNMNLMFDGTTIARLAAPPYEVKKNFSADLTFPVTSLKIPLNPEQMSDVKVYLDRDVVRFDLRGDVRARWKVGLIGSVRFWCHLDCQLRFIRSNGTYIHHRCTSKAR